MKEPVGTGQRHHTTAPNQPGPTAQCQPLGMEERACPPAIPKVQAGLCPAEVREAELHPQRPLVRVTWQQEKLNDKSAVTPASLRTQNLTQNG